MIFVYRTSMVGPSGIPLSDYEEGAIIKLNEGGSPIEFYVAKHDYEPDLNGTGRTLVVRKDCYDNRVWDAGNVNAWADSDLLIWMNGTYKSKFPKEIQTAMETTTYYYTPGDGDITVTTKSDSVFMLSITELGKSNTDTNVEGVALPIASTLQIPYYNGVPQSQWTRTPVTWNNNSVCFFHTNGNVYNDNCKTENYSRPCFTLPSTLLFTPDPNEVVA